jgi:hypothetical protein
MHRDVEVYNLHTPVANQVVDLCERCVNYGKGIMNRTLMREVSSFMNATRVQCAPYVCLIVFLSVGSHFVHIETMRHKIDYSTFTK